MCIRDRYKNKDKALRVLRSRLLDAKRREQESQIAGERRSQVGTDVYKRQVRVCQSGAKVNAEGTLVSERNIPAAVAYVVKGIVLALLLFTATAMLAGNTYHPFIYFRF